MARWGEEAKRRVKAEVARREPHAEGPPPVCDGGRHQGADHRGVAGRQAHVASYTFGEQGRKEGAASCAGTAGGEWDRFWGFDELWKHIRRLAA